VSSFQLVGIDHEPFEPLFRLTDAELRDRGARRCVATESPGFPCRISLQDAAPGEELLLLPFAHQPANSPYRSSGPIFVRRGAKRRALGVDEVSPYVTTRLMSVRVYDNADMIVAASVCEGAQVADCIREHFANPSASYIHLHNAKRGCFSCRVNRV
jgi:hypothetical protein